MMKETDDVRNVYNPDKQPNPSVTSVTFDNSNITNSTALATNSEQGKDLSLSIDGKL